MNSKGILMFSVLCCLGVRLFSTGQEEASSAERGKYLAEQGMIILPEEIHEDSYISETEMFYPEPAGPFGVTFLSDRQQISTAGQEVILLIGIQGRRLKYEDLPTVNQALVIDKSGSMYQKDKMEWVKEAFGIFIENVRKEDVLSLVVFDDEARVLIPPTQVRNAGVKQKFREAVGALVPGGGSNLRAALELGFEQVLSAYREDNVNRLLFLTDGIGNSEGILEMAAEHHKMGIEISSIGMGLDFNQELIRDLAIQGGGTSRFISGRESMEEIFGSGLSRTISPAARDLELSLQFFLNPESIETWAPDYELLGQWDGYALREWDDVDSEAIVPSMPLDLAIDSDGNVYVTDRANGRIQKFDSGGNFLSQHDGSGIFRGGMQDPSAVAVDEAGNVFIADTANNRIMKFDSSGAFIGQWGRKGNPSHPDEGRDRFQSPQGIAVDGEGNVFVSDTANHRIQKFDNDGGFLAQWGKLGSKEGEFRYPMGIATDRFRNVYVADSMNNRVQVFESDGTYITQFGGLTSPGGLAIGPEGALYASTVKGRLITKLDILGTYQTHWDGTGPAGRPFANVTGIEVDSDGNVYAADAGARSIHKFDGAGVYLYRQPVRFFFPTINLSDHETVLLRARLPAGMKEGAGLLARLNVSYTNLQDERVSMAPMDLSLHFVAAENPVDGISDATVLKAGTVLHYAQALKKIGGEYRDGRVSEALDMTNEIKKEILNARQRLGDEDFKDEITVLENYISILGADAGYGEAEIERIIRDDELEPVSKDRDLFTHLHNLFREVALDLRSRLPGNIAVLGFNLSGRESAGIIDLLEKTAESSLFNLPEYTLLERDKVDAVLDVQELSHSDLMDADQAVQAGRMLTARYVLTGNIVEMSRSVVIFSRVIDVETGAIASVSQVIAPKDEDLESLL